MMEATNSLAFCTSCHEMRDTVYREYKETIHYSNRTGVRAICSDCHVPKNWVHKVARKFKARNKACAVLCSSAPSVFDGTAYPDASFTQSVFRLAITATCRCTWRR
jgi:cytochrome c-type protein NapC